MTVAGKPFAHLVFALDACACGAIWSCSLRCFVPGSGCLCFVVFHGARLSPRCHLNWCRHHVLGAPGHPNSLVWTLQSPQQWRG